MGQLKGPATASVQGSLSRGEHITLSVHRWLDRHLSPLGVWMMRRSKGRVTDAWKVNALVLTTRGRRSGRERGVVLQYFPDGDAMIVVAANDGGDAHPGWYYNLIARPDAAVEVNGQRVRVRALELHRDEATLWWKRILAAAPAYERYRRATTRPFPILRLLPAEARRTAAA
jgi:deazaflavin-dependent oxidoreductase (nitroreductase family)